MASDDIFDLENLDDTELARLVREELGEHAAIDSDSIIVRVTNGKVTLTGRVGTEEERLVADHILSDVIGLQEYANDLFVDPIVRAEQPEAADEAEARLADDDSGALGDTADDQDPEAAHLGEDLDARLYGTRDVQQAIEEGTPWVPPDRPTAEGGDR
ncbi:MAG: BON domain-containing protein [Gemmatimonadaceae bacterium]